MILKYFLPLIFCVGTCGNPQTVPPLEHQNNMAIFILAGQSNMSGRGQLPARPVNVDSAYVFGNDWAWHVLQEPSDSPVGQVDIVSLDTNAGYSAVSSFARAWLAHHPGRAVGLVTCAKGGSFIGQWQRNLARDSLYGSCLARAQVAGAIGEIEGLLFYQGESDAMLDPLAHTDDYAPLFEQFVADFRLDLNRPDLPVVFVQIGAITEDTRFPNWAIIQQQQARVTITHTSMITVTDLISGPVHLDQQAQDALGERFAGVLGK